MILTRVRIAIAVLGLLGASFVLWRIHDALAEQRVRRAVEAVQEQVARKEAERIKAARAYHADIAALSARIQNLKRQVNVEDKPECAWGADTVRLLNAARGYGTAGQLSGALSKVAEAGSARSGNREGER